MANGLLYTCVRRAIVFNTTFNNISVILWRSVLLVEETGVLFIEHIQKKCSIIYMEYWFLLIMLLVMPGSKPGYKD